MVIRAREEHIIKNNALPKNMDIVTDDKLDQYFAITGEALHAAKNAIDASTTERESQAKDFLDMAQRYYDDARHFREKGDKVLAFAALNYAHGWLDAGARIRLFTVNDDRLFTVDAKPR